MIRRIFANLFKNKKEDEYKEIIKCDRCGKWNTKSLCKQCCSKARY